MIKALKTNFTYKNIFGSFVWAMILSVVFYCVYIYFNIYHQQVDGLIINL